MLDHLARVLLLGLAFVSPSFAQPPTDRNMVANPGFEQLMADGRAVGWAYDRSVYRVSDESPHSGKSCLRFENHDSGRYVLCSKSIKLLPGNSYELEVWVRTEGVKGADSGAALCIEWRSDKGKWMGGSYVRGIKGTHRKWQRIRGRTQMIPEGAAGFTISCYVRKGMTGVAWWDDLVVRQYFPPLVDTIVTDAYRNLIDTGPISVDVGLRLKAYHGMRWTPKFIKSREDERRVIEEKVTQLRDHPAIMAWYINDELPLSMLDPLTRHRDWLEQLDPGRPTWVVLYQVDHVRSYLPTFDVIGTDPYPIPERSIAMPLQWTRKTVDAVFKKRAVWMVPQIFDWAAYRRAPEQEKKSRPPTLQEMRCMAWQCIAGGANGLVFYSWFDLWKMNKVEPFETRWKDVTTVAAEIKQLVPVLLSIQSAPMPTVSGDTDAIGWRVYAKEKDVYLVAVNADRQPASVTAMFPDMFRKATSLLGNQPPELNGRSISLSFEPMEVKVLRLSR